MRPVCGWEPAPPGGEPTGYSCRLAPHDDDVIHALGRDRTAEGPATAAPPVVRADAAGRLFGPAGYRYSATRDRMVATPPRPPATDRPDDGHVARHRAGRDQQPETD